MLIGTSGELKTGFPPEECGRRLSQDRFADSYIGHANGSGFQLAKYGRTAVRIRGTFTPSGAGSEVDYRLEFIPAMLWALVLAYAIGIPVVVVLIWLHYIPLSTLGLVVVITVVLLPINVWFSERQAESLRKYVASVLDARSQ